MSHMGPGQLSWGPGRSLVFATWHFPSLRTCGLGISSSLGLRVRDGRQVLLCGQHLMAARVLGALRIRAKLWWLFESLHPGGGRTSPPKPGWTQVTKAEPCDPQRAPTSCLRLCWSLHSVTERVGTRRLPRVLAVAKSAWDRQGQSCSFTNSCWFFATRETTQQIHSTSHQ